MDKYLIIDIERIQNFIYNTNRLKEIYGGSWLLDYVNREKIKEWVDEAVPDNEVIYLGGGGGIIKLNTKTEEKDKEIIKKLKEKVKLEYGLDITCIITDKFDSKLIEKELKEEKNGRSNEIKYLGNFAIDLLDSSFVKICESCGLEVAETKYYEPMEEKEEFICLGCNKKREFRTDIKKGKIKTEDGDIKKYILKSEDEFNKIPTKGPDWRNYIALIYADGNSIGKELTKIEAPTEFKNFSASLDKASKESVKTVLNYLNNKGLKYNLIIAGGDDVVLITPAEIGFMSAIKITEEFYRLTSGKLSLSTAVVIAHNNFPFTKMVQYAKDILKVTKLKRDKLLKKDPHNNAKEGMIGYVIVTSDIGAYVTEYYKELKVEINDIYNFSSQPYTLTQLKELIKTVITFKDEGFPATQINNLKHAIEKGGNLSIFSSLNIISKHILQNEKLSKILRNRLLSPPDFDYESDKKIIWFKDKKSSNPKEYTTMLYDFTEIYKFINPEYRDLLNE